MVVASLGAQRKQKSGGKVTDRVQFDGTHGLCVNSRTRLGVQERVPIAVKRAVRERAQADRIHLCADGGRFGGASTGTDPPGRLALSRMVGGTQRRRVCIRLGRLALLPRPSTGLGRSRCGSIVAIPGRLFVYDMAHAGC